METVHTTDDLAEIRARRARATATPWRHEGDEVIDPGDLVVAEVAGRGNPEFIAHAPSDIDRLLGIIDRLRAEAEQSPDVEDLIAQLRDATRAAAQLADEASRERDARAALSLHVTELERELREAKAELAATRRAGVTLARPHDWVRDD